MEQIITCKEWHNKASVLTIKNIEKDKDGADLKITGYASTFDNLDSYGDIVKKGAFTKSIKESGGKWPVLLNHRDQIGMNIKGSEDKKGLYIESKIFSKVDDLPKAKEAVALIKKNAEYGVPIGLSIGGLLKKIKFIHEKNPEDGFPIKMEIIEFDLKEHSVTPIPANMSARVKQLNKSALMEKIAKTTPHHTASKDFLVLIKKLAYEFQHESRSRN